MPWKFSDNLGTFESPAADKIRSLYFPLANETLISSLTPDLHGDIKSGQDSFLLEPVSRINLSSSRVSRNFWVYLNQDKIWSACGVSKNLRQIQADRFNLEAGLLWHKITRENKAIGLKSEIISFIPASGEAVEIMQVRLTNISAKKIKFTPSAAIPLYARSANNLRDHRHVTSLLQRITLNQYGVISKPTLAFDEAGHRPNKEYYFVLGVDGKGKPPEYLYPTQEMFCGEGGDLEAPEAVLNNLLPDQRPIQGKEPMGGLRFQEVTLNPGRTAAYIILMGITQNAQEINRCLNKFNSLKKVEAALQETKLFWQEKGRAIKVSSADSDFDHWLNWVNIQPALRKIFGCSFLPDFDYGKGGRGWRDLWQDGLGLILSDPKQARALLLNNFGGVRIDGSNATIIGKKPGEFIADRNDIARVWMDHGIWPLITTDLYIHETGDLNILFAEAPYFRDRHIWRSRKISRDWKGGKICKGSVYEHLLIQNLTQFFNVGPHNHIRLEGADWNDGLDMAQEFGESVTFSAMYAQNLNRLAELLLKTKKNKISFSEEIFILLKNFNYNDRNKKIKILEAYFAGTEGSFSGKKRPVNTVMLARNLKIKALWMTRHIRKTEWLKEGFFNGYYDNRKKRVEGRVKGLLRMCLASQVFPLISGVADDRQITKIIESVNKYLLDKQLKGYHLNTDFKNEQHNLGRAFSFAYGDKENGAIFSHMVVMYGYGLYSRGFAKEGWEALSSLYRLAADTKNSKIYPCLPEYFNGEGRGMYAYLTGSASWFILTLLTQAFGVRGESGNLLIEPKLVAKQFGRHPSISINRLFAGSQLRLNFTNPKKLDYGRYEIIKASLNSRPIPLTNTRRLLIKRKALLKNASNSIDIVLGCRKLILAIFLIFCSFISSAAAASEAKEMKIVTSFYPLYIMAKNAVKDLPGASVQNLTPSYTGCLHDYTVTTSDMKKLAGARVFIANGAGMESFLEKIIAQHPKLKIIELCEGVPLIKGEGNTGDNPHVWVSISNAIIQVKNLGKAMEEFDPGHKELYVKNTADYAAKLETLRQKMHSELVPYQARPIVTFHQAFPYFAREFGLVIAAVVEREPGSEPSAKELADTIEIIKRNNIAVLFSEPQYPAGAARTIAGETGAKIYVLDPAVTGPDDPDAYINIMEENLKVLKEAFSGLQ